MKAKISYRMEIEIEGENLNEIRREYESVNLAPDERAKFVETIYVCDGDTYNDLTSEFENC